MTEQLTVRVKVEHIEHLTLIAQIELHSYYVTGYRGSLGQLMP